MMIPQELKLLGVFHDVVPVCIQRLCICCWIILN